MFAWSKYQRPRPDYLQDKDMFMKGVENVMRTTEISEEDEKKRNSYIALITLTKSILETCTDLLAIKVPDRM